MKKYNIVAPTIIIAITILFLVFSEKASIAAYNALSMAISSIIPSLFPFMVISTIIITNGSTLQIGRLIPISKIFSLPDCVSISIILGVLCGFPLGAQNAVDLYRKGHLRKGEAEILISISSIASPTFIIHIIGSSIWQNKSFGIYLYVIQLLAILISSLIINTIMFPEEIKPNYVVPNFENENIFLSFTTAIKNSAISCIYICGYITFFSSLIEIIKILLSNAPNTFVYLIIALFEFTNASFASAKIGGLLGHYLCGFAIGWSGISILCQISALTVNTGISLKRYIMVKLFQGNIIGISSVIYYYCQNSASIMFSNKIMIINIIIIAIITLCIFYIVKKRKVA